MHPPSRPGRLGATGLVVIRWVHGTGCEGGGVRARLAGQAWVWVSDDAHNHSRLNEGGTMEKVTCWTLNWMVGRRVVRSQRAPVSCPTYRWDSLERGASDRTSAYVG